MVVQGKHGEGDLPQVLHPETPPLRLGGGGAEFIQERLVPVNGQYQVILVSQRLNHNL